MAVEELESVYEVMGRDYVNAGKASTAVKEALKGLGINPVMVRRIAIACFEAEMNVVMYARHGRITLRVAPEVVALDVVDEGPGIANIELAMQEGYSTSTQEMREMGFGAGLGLPNIRKNADQLEITSEPGQGTRLWIRFQNHS